MALSATATPDALASLKETMVDPLVLQVSVNRPNIYLEAHEIKSFSYTIPVANCIHAACIRVGLIYACTLLVHYTGDTKKISYWAEVVASFISEQRSIVYVDFVEDAALVAIKLTEKHGIRTGIYCSCSI